MRPADADPVPAPEPPPPSRVRPYRLTPLPRSRAGGLRSSTPAGEATGRRHVTWLELFFDLVFVFAIAELAGLLHGDASAAGIKHFALLFVPVWWQWMGYSYYADQFDSDEVPDGAGFRATMQAAMFLTVVLAVTIHGALDGGGVGFALTYGSLRLLLVALYVHAGRAVPAARALCDRFAAGFALGAGLWFASLAVPDPWRSAVWAAALAVEIAAPVWAYLTTPTVPAQRSHMPERFGLFTIIVLGEAIVVVGTGIAETDWAARSVLIAAAGFALAAGLWWLYFDRVDEEAISRAVADGGTRALAVSFVYGYSHLFVYGGITAAAVGIEFAVEEAGHAALTGGARATLCGGVAVVLLAVTLLQRVSGRGLPDRVAVARVGAAGVVALVGLAELPPLAVAAMVAGIVVGLTAYEVVLATRPAAGPLSEVAEAAA